MGDKIFQSSQGKDIKVPRVQEINNSNFDANILALVAEAAVEKIISANGGSEANLMPTGRKLIDSIYRGLVNIRDGVPFSAYANYNGELQTLVVKSSGRSRFYSVTADGCQCESQSYNGYCVHRTTFGLFSDYFKAVRADEDRARKYAELGIEIIEVTRTEFPNEARQSDRFTDLPPELQDLFGSLVPPGFEIEDIRILPVGPSGYGGTMKYRG